MSARWLSLLVWSLVAASAVYWGLQLFARAAAAPAQTVLAASGDAQRGDLTRLLGTDTPAPVAAATAPEPAADNRFMLLGVVSTRGANAASHSRDAVALIAVDGKPAKAFKVGATVDGQQVLQSVGPRSANLGPRGAPAQVQLQIPPLAEAARGTPAGLGTGPDVGPPPSLPGSALPGARSFVPPTTAGPNVPQQQVQQPVTPPGQSPSLSPGMSPGTQPAGLPQVSSPPPRAPRTPSPGQNGSDAASMR